MTGEMKNRAVIDFASRLIASGRVQVTVEVTQIDGKSSTFTQEIAFGERLTVHVPISFYPNPEPENTGCTR